MSVSNYVFVAILVSALVTWIPRITPFVFTKYFKLPKIVAKLLKFLPITIISALLLQCLLQERTGGVPTFKLLECIAFFPALFIAIRTKDLMKTVITGVFVIALLRVFM
ncbi:Branched-chain amino acid transport protein [Pilibacter termitis]|uniref:Branched-chain amino acid transport protein n=1 Tax=Pilibacter termitis TaxID=263852 RepID=A0A1T4NQ99_9ENTE|nr:AzlD domain-containing protein [Pilibacter termitis]SJZ81394.1 Branched-chain amino acid transport protein [Pilibacter termitis]